MGSRPTQHARHNLKHAYEISYQNLELDCGGTLLSLANSCLLPQYSFPSSAKGCAPAGIPHRFEIFLDGALIEINNNS